MSLVITSAERANCIDSARTPFSSRSRLFCHLLIMFQPRSGRFTPEPGETVHVTVRGKNSFAHDSTVWGFPKITVQIIASPPLSLSLGIEFGNDNLEGIIWKWQSWEQYPERVTSLPRALCSGPSTPWSLEGQHKPGLLLMKWSSPGLTSSCTIKSCKVLGSLSLWNGCSVLTASYCFFVNWCRALVGWGCHVWRSPLQTLIMLKTLFNSTLFKLIK